MTFVERRWKLELASERIVSIEARRLGAVLARQTSLYVVSPLPAIHAWLGGGSYQAAPGNLRMAKVNTPYTFTFFPRYSYRTSSNRHALVSLNHLL